MKFCAKCVMPDTRPDLRFDSEGVCDACRSAEKKHGLVENCIDWNKRKEEFEELIRQHHPKGPPGYDCVIPVSGGKDSFTTMYYAKKVCGLNPLCICFEPTLPTKIGRMNLENINKLGVDLIHFKRNPVIY